MGRSTRKSAGLLIIGIEVIEKVRGSVPARCLQVVYVWFNATRGRDPVARAAGLAQQLTYMPGSLAVDLPCADRGSRSMLQSAFFGAASEPGLGALGFACP